MVVFVEDIIYHIPGSRKFKNALSIFRNFVRNFDIDAVQLQRLEKMPSSKFRRPLLPMFKGKIS